VNACGDFTLMSRAAWDRLRGYPELEIFSMHLDSVLLYQAWSAGLREVALPEPMVAYHIEHAVGSGWSVEGEAKLNARLAETGIEQLPVERLNAWAIRMRRERRPMELSGEGWGLTDEDLVETRPVAAEAAVRPISLAKPQAA
jgi:GT2 family glycosyltransferase